MTKKELSKYIKTDLSEVEGDVLLHAVLIVGQEGGVSVIKYGFGSVAEVVGVMTGATHQILDKYVRNSDYAG